MGFVQIVSTFRMAPEAVLPDEEVAQPEDQVVLPDKREEEAFYAKGMEHYRKNEFKEALKQFRAYAEFTMDTAIFYEIAVCHEQLGEDEEAVEAYQNYLEHGNPPIQRRKAVEEEIGALKKLIAKKGKQEKVAAPVVAPVATPDPAASPAPDPFADLASPPAEEKSSFLRKGKWSALGLSILSFGTAGLFYKKALEKDKEHADRVNQLVDEGAVMGNPGAYRFASEAAKQEYAGELNSISSDLHRYQNTAVGFFVGGLACAGISLFFFLGDRDENAEVSVDVEGTTEAKLKFEYQF